MLTDGVLNCATSLSRCGQCLGMDKDKLRRLKRIIDETGAKIVIISTWKNYYTLGTYHQIEPFAKYMSNRFREWKIGVLDKIRDKRWIDRGDAILAWLDEHPEVTSWVVLDDQRFMWYKDEEDTRIEQHWVRTFFHGHGLNEACTDAAIKILNDEMIGPFFDET